MTINGVEVPEGVLVTREADWWSKKGDWWTLTRVLPDGRQRGFHISVSATAEIIRGAIDWLMGPQRPTIKKVIRFIDERGEPMMPAGHRPGGATPRVMR